MLCIIGTLSEIIFIHVYIKLIQSDIGSMKTLKVYALSYGLKCNGGKFEKYFRHVVVFE